MALGTLIDALSSKAVGVLIPVEGVCPSKCVPLRSVGRTSFLPLGLFFRLLISEPDARNSRSTLSQRLFSDVDFVWKAKLYGHFN